MPDDKLRLSSEPAFVRDDRGHVVPSEILICAHGCGSRAFHVLQVPARGTFHPHYQCVDCGTSYCSGDCAEPEE